MKSVLKMFWTAIALSPALLLTAPVTAQSIPITAAPDGTGTVILPNGQRFDITGGTQAGTNLFHSFQQFGLNQGQIANFLSQPNIQNILGRVVGGDPSVINGIIQLTGGNSNLYIMNPAGIIFGNNASLNVPASFTATTANGIQVGNSWFGMNTSASDLQNLTGTPNAFAFTSPTSPLTQGQTSGVIVNQGNLTASAGQSISLVGGIVINTGAISTANGTINIVAVPDGKYVRITPDGGVLSFDLPIATQQELGNAKPITGIDLPKLLAGTGITAPTQAGEAIATGNLAAANINVLANRYNTTQASLNATNIQQGWNFVFVDSTVKNYQTLLDGTKGGSSVTVINPDQFGIAQVTATLASVTGANSLHIVSEGDAGNFWLGKDFVSSENIAKYANDLQAWKTSLSPAANILLYACNLANGDNGAALVQAVKNYTGHDVAASTNRTGAVAFGGDWNLEYQTGLNPATVIFNDAATNAYQNVLAIFTAINAGDAGAGSLRQAVIDANAAAGADEIRFAPSLNGVEIFLLTSGEITITEALTISGNGSTNTIINGSGNSRIFNVLAAVPITVDGATIRNGRTTGGDGGGIRSSGVLTLTNSTVSGNTANNGSGGGIFGNGVTLTNSTVSGNMVGSSNGGGGIGSDGAVTLTNSTVSGNMVANGDGGGIRSNGAVTLTDSTVSGNMAGGGGGNGGGIRSNGAVTLTNSTVSNNTASNQGGGIRSGAVTLTNSTVSGNTAASGGGIFSTGNVTLTNSSTVSSNMANGFGGGISSVGNVTLTDSTVSSNTASGTGGGGGINSDGVVTLTNSTVSGNTANTQGGGIRSSIGAVTLTNSTVSGNTASSFGGGINSGGAVTLTNSTVSGNSSNVNGGGIFSNVAVTLTNSTVSGNTANDGAGINSGGAVTLTNSTVSGNTAGFFGGGINSGGAVTLTNSTVSGNTAVNNGGGINSNGAVTLTNSTVSGNRAGNDGGGVWGDNGGSITNSTITNNIADADNNGTGDGGGIRSLGGTFTITNSIIAGNFDTPNNAGGGVINPDVRGTFVDGGNNLIGDTTGSANFTVSTLVGTAANRLNPQLAPLANNGGTTLTHALLTNSPALDAGNNANAPVGNDQRGAARISNGTVDIGSFESQVTPTPTPTPAITITTTSTSTTTTNQVANGFGGVFPSRETLEVRSRRLDEQDLELSFSQVLCLDPSLANAQTTSISTCQGK